MGIENYSTTPGSNTSQLGMATGPGTLQVSNIDDAIRKLMADLATWYAAAQPLIATISGKQSSNAILSALVGGGGGVDTFPYYTGPDTASRAAITALARTLLSKATQQEMCLTIGATAQAAYSLTDPGYVKFSIGSGVYFMVAWGTFTATANTTTAVNYAASFPNASFPLVNAGRVATGAQDNDAFAQGGAATTSGFTVFSAADTSNAGYYIAVGF
jgi:hypothetical protein